MTLEEVLEAWEGWAKEDYYGLSIESQGLLIAEIRRLRDVVADQKAYIARADDVRGKLTKTLDERTNCLMDLHELLVDTREQLESYEI